MKEKHTPKISVITVNLNNLQGLKKTVQSVVKQTYNDYEYIIIDGGSKDGSKEYIENISQVDYWVSEPDRGIYNAMNKAIVVAQGEYCIFMNSGDIFCDDNVLKVVVPRLNGKDFYIGEPIYVNGEKQWREKQPNMMSVPFLLIGAPNHQSTFTKTKLLKERFYNEKHKIVSDWEFFFKEWLLHNKSYEWLNILIAYYDLTGFSNTNKELAIQERQEVINELIHPNYYRKLENKFDPTTNIGKFEEKLNKSLNLSPFKRDLKIIRNAFKLLIRDILSH